MEHLSTLLAIILSAFVGLVLGRVIRTLTPSFLKLKNRNLPFSWPWVEFTGMVFFGITAWTHGLHPSSIPGFLFALFLLAIMACDFGWKLIPDSLSTNSDVSRYKQLFMRIAGLIEPRDASALIILLEKKSSASKPSACAHLRISPGNFRPFPERRTTSPLKYVPTPSYDCKDHVSGRNHNHSATRRR